MQSVLTKSTTNAPVSASKHPILGTADFSTPERAGVGVTSPAPDGVITTASIYAYFGSGVGYRLVRVAIQERNDATVLAMILPCGETARIWAYPHGVGIQVQSKSHAGRWHEVTAARCTCERWHYQHRCTHHDVAASEALEVYERWQRFSGYEAQKAVA